MSAVLVSLSLAFCAASCVQITDETSAAGGGADQTPPILEAQDESEIGGDLELDVRSEPPDGNGASELDDSYEAGDWFTYRLCVLLKGGPTAARAAFCLNQPTTDVRSRCFSHLNDSPASWANWCYNEFAE